MRVATSTNIISSHRARKRVPMIEFIPFLSEKFKILDLNFCEMMNPDSLLLTDQYKSYVGSLIEYRNKYDLEYNQCHAPYTHGYFELPKNRQERLNWEIERSIEMAGMLDIPYVVLHSATDKNNYENSFEANLKWLKSFVKLAKVHNTSIALENLTYDKSGQVEFTSQAEELVQLIEALDSDNVGACYDFGHANMVAKNHEENILTLGEHLKCTHVADNNGIDDQHLMPFHGTVPWEKCIDALKKINYKGDFTYEIMFFSENIPQEVHKEFLDYAYSVADHLVKRFNES
ncbi:MAG: sugar phosphate isomerase/epimerase family protein [Sphaerochaetaceae bacterium]